jgi:uncharacterized membrane protein (DUF2068 family)
VLLLGLLQWTRAWTLFARQSYISQLGLPIPLPYAVGSAAIWGGLLVVAGIGLWKMTRWGRWLTLGAVTLSLAHTWLDRWLFERSDYSQLSTGFSLAVTIAVLITTWAIVLGRTRQANK